MSHLIVEDGEVLSDYAKFKAFCQGTSATIIYHDHDGRLRAKGRAGGHTLIWQTNVQAEKDMFHADFAGAYEVA